MNLSSHNYCHICGELFSLTNQKKYCPSCNLPVCKVHSKNIPNSICDFCFKENLIKNNNFPNKDLRDKLKNELIEIQRDNHNGKSIIREQDNKIKHFQTQLKNLIEKMKNVQTIYEEKIKKQDEKNEIFVETLRNIEKSNEEMINAENTMQEKIESFEKKNAEIESEIEEEKNLKFNLLKELEEFKEKREKFVLLQVVKSKICKICYHKIEYLYEGDHKNNSFQENSLTNKPCCCQII